MKLFKQFGDQNTGSSNSSQPHPHARLRVNQALAASAAARIYALNKVMKVLPKCAGNARVEKSCRTAMRALGHPEREQQAWSSPSHIRVAFHSTQAAHPSPVTTDVSGISPARHLGDTKSTIRSHGTERCSGPQFSPDPRGFCFLDLFRTSPQN